MKQSKLFYFSGLLFFFLFSSQNNISNSETEIPQKLKTNTEFLHPDEAFVPHLSKIDSNHIEIKWDIKDGYYLYMGMFNFQIDSENIKIKTVKMPEGSKKHDEFFGDVDVYYRTTKADIYIINPENDKFNLIVTYQGCAEAGLCYPPIKKIFSLPSFSSSKFFYKTSIEEDQFNISDSLNSKSLIFNIIFFYFAGLLLAFTPCVFPMIPILTGLIARQGDSITTKKSFNLSLIYVLSMSITYAIIGVIFALSGSNIQSDLQNPYVISLFAGLFIILALAMFEIINLEMPKTVQISLSQSSNKLREGSFLSIAIMGVLSAFIIGPCVTAPLIGALIYITSSNDFILGGFVLFTLGLGMGTPLLVLGTSASRILKIVGPYLEYVNRFFGLLFLIVAIWLLERVISIQLAAYLWSILPITIIYIYYFHKKKSFNINYLSKIIILLLLSYSTLLIYGANKNENFVPITSFIKKQSNLSFIKVKSTNDLFKTVSNSEKISMVDLYADWCVACKELETYTFSDDKVESLLSNINLIKFDITNSNEDNSNFLKRYNLFGPPTIMFFNSNGEEIKKARIVGFVDSKTFIKKIKNLDISSNSY